MRKRLTYVLMFITVTFLQSAVAKDIVVYFSATGTTARFAQHVAQVTKSDAFEIKPVQPYSQEDLNWKNPKSRTFKEYFDKTARPAISKFPNLKPYDPIYVGYPIWGGYAPKIMLTFFEKANVKGKRIVTFSTCEKSALGQSDGAIKSTAKGYRAWVSGKSFKEGSTEKDVDAWLRTLGVIR